jgi:multidrug efflux pump subunit AcrA (membrane-fusion protein)
VWVDENGKAAKRPIETGMDNQLQFEVVSGLQPGDQLITEGINLLSENARIRVVK